MALEMAPTCIMLQESFCCGETMCNRDSAVAVIADRTACSSMIGSLLHDSYFNAIHCDRSVSTCE